MGTFTSAMAALLWGLRGALGPTDDRRLDVLEGLQHLWNEILANLDEAGMLGLLLRADELTVGPLKIAFDRVVLEVVNGLGLVGRVGVVAATGRRGGCGCRICGERPAGRNQSPDACNRPEEGQTDDEIFHISFLLHLARARLLGIRQPKAPLVPKHLTRNRKRLPGRRCNAICLTFFASIYAARPVGPGELLLLFLLLAAALVVGGRRLGTSRGGIGVGPGPGGRGGAWCGGRSRGRAFGSSTLVGALFALRSSGLVGLLLLHLLFHLLLL